MIFPLLNQLGVDVNSLIPLLSPINMEFIEFLEQMID